MCLPSPTIAFLLLYSPILWIFCFQHTFSSLLKQKPLKASPPKPRATMAVSMRELDPAFQGAGQKEYPSLAYFLTALHYNFTCLSYILVLFIIYLHILLLSHTHTLGLN